MTNLPEIINQNFSGGLQSSVNARELDRVIQELRVKNNSRANNLIHSFKMLVHENPDIKFYCLNKNLHIAVTKNNIFINNSSLSLYGFPQLAQEFVEDDFIEIYKILKFIYQPAASKIDETLKIISMCNDIHKSVINDLSSSFSWFLSEMIEHTHLSIFEKIKTLNNEQSLVEVFRRKLELNLYPGISVCYNKPKMGNHLGIPDDWVFYKNEIVPVEAKASNFNRAALKQLQRYMKEYGSEYGVAVAKNLTTQLPPEIIFIEVSTKDVYAYS